MSPGAAFAAGLLIGAVGAAAFAAAVLRRRAALYGRLFSFAMHELNTPVTAVNMTVMNLLEGVFGDLPASHRPWIEMAREQVGRLSALVGEIRDLVHMELHKELRLNVAASSPQDIVSEAVAGLRQGFTLAGVELLLRVPEGLPSVSADVDRAPRSLASMLFHARKFRKGGPVTLTAARGEGVVDFTVSYDGPALPPEEAAASLGLFYPAMPRNDQKLAATGLGLGLIAAVMARTGGALRFDVDHDGRSRLTLSLKAVP